MTEGDQPAIDRSFPKSVRVLHRTEYLRVQQGGRRFATPRLAFMFLPAEAGLRLGVTVSKKVGPSVTRSLVKRRLREAFRQNRHAWPIDGGVVVARAPAAAASYQELEADFFAWARFMKRSAR